MKKHLIIGVLILWMVQLHVPSSAQDMVKVKMDPDSWETEARKAEFTEYQGKTCLYLEQDQNAF